MFKTRLRNWVLKNLLCAVDASQVITVEEKEYSDGKVERIVKLGGEIVSPQVIARLKEEAAYIKRTDLWNIMQNRLADVARKTMFEKSKDFNDMLSGKLMLYNLQVQKDIIDKLLE